MVESGWARRSGRAGDGACGDPRITALGETEGSAGIRTCGPGCRLCLRGGRAALAAGRAVWCRCRGRATCRAVLRVLPGDRTLPALRRALGWPGTETARAATGPAGGVSGETRFRGDRDRDSGGGAAGLPHCRWCGRTEGAFRCPACAGHRAGRCGRGRAPPTSSDARSRGSRPLSGGGARCSPRCRRRPSGGRHPGADRGSPEDMAPRAAGRVGRCCPPDCGWGRRPCGAGSPLRHWWCRPPTAGGWSYGRCGGADRAGLVRWTRPGTPVPSCRSDRVRLPTACVAAVEAPRRGAESWPRWRGRMVLDPGRDRGGPVRPRWSAGPSSWSPRDAGRSGVVGASRAGVAASARAHGRPRVTARRAGRAHRAQGAGPVRSGSIRSRSADRAGATRSARVGSDVPAWQNRGLCGCCPARRRPDPAGRVVSVQPSGSRRSCPAHPAQEVTTFVWSCANGGDLVDTCTRGWGRLAAPQLGVGLRVSATAATGSRASDQPRSTWSATRSRSPEGCLSFPG